MPCRMTHPRVKTRARVTALALVLLPGCAGPAANKPESEKVVSSSGEPSAEPVQSAALPSSSATPTGPDTASPAPKVASVDLGPPDKDSCPGYLAEARKRWPIPDRLKHCIPKDGDGMLPMGGCDETARFLIERRVVTGKPTIDELRMLRAFCKHERDAKCFTCLSWMINDAYEKQ